MSGDGPNADQASKEVQGEEGSGSEQIDSNRMIDYSMWYDEEDNGVATV
jgi:hypothetical protein